ncbi:MAG: type II toxin-antitoxin system RatA family toxin [Pseudomonadales bacterium]
MTQVNRSVLVPHTPAQMFDIVNDVEEYPHFLPWCASATLLDLNDRVMVARLEIHRGGLKQSFTTRNEFKRPHSIDLSLVEGPFSNLNGQWRFEPVSESGCKVNFFLSFEIDSRAMRFALGKVFNMAADKLVDAFCDRAEQRYG